MNLFVKFTSLGVDTGPFNIFSNVDYTSALISHLTSEQMIAGVAISNVPDDTTILRIKSVGKCKITQEFSVTNVILEEETTTTSTSSTSTTSSTTITTTTQPVLTRR